MESEPRHNDRSCRGDIFRQSWWRGLFAKYDFDYVISLRLRAMWTAPSEPEIFVQSNVMGTMNLLPGSAKEAWYDADARPGRKARKLPAGLHR